MTFNLGNATTVPPIQQHALTRPLPLLALAGAMVLLLAWNPVQAAGDGHAHGSAHTHGGNASATGEAHSHTTGHERVAHMDFGRPDEASEVDRTIEIEASDEMMFDVSSIDVRDGETIRFIIRNVGEIDHDFTIGPPAIQAAHRQEMTQMMQAGSSHGSSHNSMHGAMPPHDDPNAVMVHPGETKELIWTFAKADQVEFGCNVPGHSEAGMKGRFNFVPRQPRQS